MKIAVFGLGYVGLSNAVLLAQHHEVIAVDIMAARVDMLNARRSPIVDAELEEFLAAHPLNLTATLDAPQALVGADYVIVATPTNYDVGTNKFDTSSVETVIRTAKAANPTATIVVKSTVPVGFVEDVRQRLDTDQVIFSPEFLREGKALQDNLHPSRIIVGERSDRARVFADLLLQGAVKKDVEILFTD
ncbi:MAG: UDP-glucose 6-dehydrogenase, partial [Sphingobium sp.]|nr:UDP-glucose 6-dehydrogenase [Sphingobium sp.]